MMIKYILSLFNRLCGWCSFWLIGESPGNSGLFFCQNAVLQGLSPFEPFTYLFPPITY